MVLNMCRVLKMPEVSIFENFCKDGRVLNMRRDVIIKEFWIFQDSVYDISAYASVVQGSQYS